MAWSSDTPFGVLSARVEALIPDHRRGVRRFFRRLEEFMFTQRLSVPQVRIVAEHVVRLGERNRNPANTGNIEDLFCHTLQDTGDVIRAYAQALADSVKVVPLAPDAPLYPVIRSLNGSRSYRRAGDLDHLTPGDQMLVAHTMVGYGDPEMWASGETLVEITHPHLDAEAIDREVAHMAVQSQHLPSSSFVMARARGLTIDCETLYARAGYGPVQIANAQRFYDVCGEFDPVWAEDFVQGRIPTSPNWGEWRAQYLAYRDHLPPELIYQLSSDAVSNFLDGTLESGKWTDATVFFGGVTDSSDVPGAIARIVNQYLVEHVALHDRPAQELTRACRGALAPWGIGFDNDRAIVLPEGPQKSAELQAQFDAAMARKQG